MEKTDDEKLDEFVQSFQKHGIGCGLEIAKLARELHPDSLIIIPLYRSCIVILQDEKEKENGECTVHAYGDPHWLGRNITKEELQENDFHTEFKIRGQRESPEIVFRSKEKEASMRLSLGFDILKKYWDDLDKWMEEQSLDKDNTVSDDEEEKNVWNNNLI